MKEHKITTYSFSELSPEAQKTALSYNWDLNLLHEWWINTYGDAENVGLRVDSFEIDGANYCNLKFIETHICVAMDILKNHGDKTDTYQAAKQFFDIETELRTRYNIRRQKVEGFDDKELNETEANIEQNRERTLALI